MMLKNLLLAFAIACSFVINGHAQEVAAICKSILESGMKNTYSRSFKNSMSSAERKKLCSESSGFSSSSSNTDVAAWYGATGGSYGAGSAEAKQFREWFCSDNEYSASSLAVEKINASFYDKNMVSALETCIKSATDKHLNNVSIDIGDDSYTVMISSSNTTNMFVDEILMNNFKCSGSLSKYPDGQNNKVLRNGASELMLCKRELATPAVCPDGTPRYKGATLIVPVNGFALKVANLGETNCFIRKKSEPAWVKSTIESMNLMTTNSCSANGSLSKTCDSSSLNTVVDIWREQPYAALGGPGGQGLVAGNQGTSVNLSGNEITWSGKTGSCETVVANRANNVERYTCQKPVSLPILTRFMRFENETPIWSHTLQD